MTAIRDLCKGKWPSLLTMFGIDRQYLTGKNVPCPMCGGKDRFCFDDKKGTGTWICRQQCTGAQAGDGFSLLMAFKGWDFKTCAAEVEAVVGKAEATQARRTRDRNQLRESMNRVWQLGTGITRGDGAAYYLERRGIVLTEYPKALRFVERCYYKDPEAAPAYHPAMIAKISAPDGKPANVHRTYLDGQGGKLDVEEPRKMMAGSVEKGSAVRLATLTGKVLGVGTGIETSLAASLLFDVPVWATLNDALLMQWEPPEGVEKVLIFGDNDANFSGQQAAYALARRLANKGYDVEVHIPDHIGEDWNNVLVEQLTERLEKEAMYG